MDNVKIYKKKIDKELCDIIKNNFYKKEALENLFSDTLHNNQNNMTILDKFLEIYNNWKSNMDILESKLFKQFYSKASYEFNVLFATGEVNITIYDNSISDEDAISLLEFEPQ